MKQEILELNEFEIHDVEKLEVVPFLDAVYDVFRINMFLKKETIYSSALLITHKDFNHDI